MRATGAGRETTGLKMMVQKPSTLMVGAILFLAWIVLVTANPSDQPCDGSSAWVRGGPFNSNGRMSVSKFSTSTTGCVLSINPSSATYGPGQVFTVTTSSTSSLYQKIEAVGQGAVLAWPTGSPTRAGRPSDTCLYYDASTKSRSFKFTAPNTGSTIRLRALCGNDNVMNVASEIVLAPGPGVTPISTTGNSTDPSYNFMAALDGNGKMKVYFSTNSSHASVKVTYAGQGYVGIGSSASMPGAYFLMGLDPTLNSGKSGVALYRLSNDYVGTVSVTASPAQLASYGVLSPSYTYSNGESALRFVVLISAQQAAFNLIQPGGVSVIYSAGPSTYQQHIVRGSLAGQDFISGTVGVSGPPGGSDPGSGGAGGGTASSDPDYLFESQLEAGVTIYFKKNATHGSFRVSLTNSNGYVSIGTGTQMVGATVLVGMDPTVNPGYSAVGIYKINSKTGSNAQIMSNLAVTPNDMFSQFGVTDTSFTTTGTTTDLRFAIALKLQKSPLTFFPGTTHDGSVDIIYATGSSVYGLHTKFGTQNFNFASGAGGGGGVRISNAMAAHIAFMILAWELLVPFGVLVPLFNNVKHGASSVCGLSTPAWFKFHWVTLSLGVISGFIGSATGYYYVYEKQSDHFMTMHEQLGLVLFVFSILQPLWGRFRPAKAKSGTEKSISREAFENGHPSVGYILFFFGMVNCLLGVPELAKALGNQDFLYGPFRGETGFSGALGAVIVTLFSVFLIIALFGFWRSYVNGQAPASRFDGAENKLVSPASANPSGYSRVITPNEVASHNTALECWVIYQNKVYDVTTFLSSHPGGKRALVQHAGQDITAKYIDVGHSKNALAIMSRYEIGALAGSTGRGGSARALGAPPKPPKPGTVSATPENPIALLNGKNEVRRPVKVIEKTLISKNVYMIKFALPPPRVVLGLPHGKHITIYARAPEPVVRGQWNGQSDSILGDTEIQRKYTPISNDHNDVGHFTLVIKVYRPDPSKGMPDGGKMSRYIDSLEVGDVVQIAGPFGTHEYLGGGKFLDGPSQIRAIQIGMVAGGSGITPIYQLARAMLENPNDPCQISILYANSTLDDVLLKDQLDELECLYPKRLSIWYTISKPPGSAWPYSIGRISKEMIERHFPPPSSNALIIACGPEPMIDHVSTLLLNVGYSDRQILVY